MRRRLVIKPEGLHCTLAECRPGYFIFCNEFLGYKSKHLASDGRMEIYNDSGDYLYSNRPYELLLELNVQPVTYAWEEDEEIRAEDIEKTSSSMFLH